MVAHAWDENSIVCNLVSGGQTMVVYNADIKVLNCNGSGNAASRCVIQKSSLDGLRTPLLMGMFAPNQATYPILAPVGTLFKCHGVSDALDGTYVCTDETGIWVLLESQASQ